MNRSLYFETERLRIEPLSAADVPFIFELVNTEGWLKNIGHRHVYDSEDAAMYIQTILLNPVICYWVVKLKAGMTAIGIVTFIQREHLPFPDLGFAFLPQFAGQGYAHEATLEVLSRLFRSGLYTSILATTIPENERSISLLKKLGFEPDKRFIAVTNNTLIFSKSVT